jgi:hypothetical protein
MNNLNYSLKITLLCLVYIFWGSNIVIKAQDIDELNKKELKTALKGCINLKDSLTQLVSSINYTNNNNQIKITELNAEIARLKQTVEEYSTKLVNEERKFREVNIALEKAENSIKQIGDSLKEIKSPLAGDIKYDFLNNYFSNPYPLNKASFNFRFEKVLLGKAVLINNDYSDQYDQDYDFGFFINDLHTSDYSNAVDEPYEKAKSHQYLPEFLNIDELTINVENVDSLLPRIEILKNKLVTFYYKNGTEENFLFNIYEGDKNNFKKTLQIELASEDVQSDGSKNRQKDMIWKIFQLNNECYLLLTAKQLKRINFPIKEFLSNYYNTRTPENNGHIVFSRKPSNNECNPINMIFLFKLISK